MKLARRRGSVAGSAASSRSGRRGQQLLEHHAQLEAGERLAEAEVRAEAERDVLVRVALDVEAVRVGELRLVAVRRLVEQHALLAFVQLLAHELDVVGDRAAHVLDRADPAQHLLDRDRDLGRVVRRAACRCSGCSSSCSMPPLITWRVVSSPPMRMSSDSCSTSSGREAVAVDLGVHEHAHEVVGRRRPGAARRRACRTSVYSVIAFIAATNCSSVALPLCALDHVVGPAQQVVAVLGRDAEHVADQDHRQRRGDVADEVALAALAHGVDDRVARRRGSSARCRAPGRA